jgi:hypothetical protein
MLPDMDQLCECLTLSIMLSQRKDNQRRETLVNKALRSIVNNVDQFSGQIVKKYLRIYARDIKLNRVEEREMVVNFELPTIMEIRDHVSDEKSWNTFTQALKEEFFMEDSKRMTKITFLRVDCLAKQGFVSK